MNALWNAAEVAAIFDLELADEWSASRVVIDSRNVQPGDLFVAIEGQRVDGHDYVQQAADAGAVAALVSKPVSGLNIPTIQVADTLAALRQMGVASRKRTAAQVIGITGSVGKTGCKEMLRAALEPQGRVFATEGNYNNHIGVPLTLVNLPADADFAVIEMGMNHAGEISQLSTWVRPDISIITTVDAVHIENFDSVEGIADAKSEIFDGMHGVGVAMLNLDNPYYQRVRRHAEAADLDRIMTFGVDDKAICRMKEYRVEGLESLVDAIIAGTRVKYRIGAIGKHWGLMSVAILGIIDALGLDISKSAEALEYFSEPVGRGNITRLAVEGGHLRLIDDSYNASPVSMQAAFEKMSEIRAHDVTPPRLLAVLGDMLELGEHSRDLHVGLVPTLVNNQIDLVFAAGSFMKSMYDALPESMQGDYDHTAAALAPKVVNRLKNNDLVLVKGSHGSQMSDVVTAIHDHAKKEEGKDAEKRG